MWKYAPWVLSYFFNVGNDFLCYGQFPGSKFFSTPGPGFTLPKEAALLLQANMHALYIIQGAVTY